ncbi:hypothetical protein OLK001_21480 [Synechocystis sp. LKSZ1]
MTASGADAFKVIEFGVIVMPELAAKRASVSRELLVPVKGEKGVTIKVTVDNVSLE